MSAFRFGDGRPAPFSTNVLLLLGDAVDACVATIALADELHAAEADATAVEQRLNVTLAELHALANQFVAQLRKEMSAKRPVVTSWASSVIQDARQRVREQEQALRAELEGHLREHRGHLHDERERFGLALGRLVAHRDLPHASETWTIEHRVAAGAGEGRYVGTRAGRTSWGLGWSGPLPMATDSTWRAEVRVRDLVSDLSIETGVEEGVLAGLLGGRSDVGRLTVLGVERSHAKTRVRLGRGTQPALDIVFGGRGNVFVFRPDDHGEPRLEVPSKEVRAELERLRSPLAQSLDRLDEPPDPLAVHLDDRPLETSAQAEALVQRIVAAIAPLAFEISRHSPSPNELVLKQTVGRGERKELFLDRQELVARVDDLPVAWRDALAPLVRATPLSSDGLETLPVSSEWESTPAGPRHLPQLFDVETPSERTVHGHSSPDVASRRGAPSNTQVSAGGEDD